LESLLDTLGIGWRECIFGADRAVSPMRGFFGGVNVRDFGHELITQSGRGFWVKDALEELKTDFRPRGTC